MCMLTFVPPGVQPDPDAIGNGAEMNRDGHGFGMIVNGEFIIRKNLDPDDLIEEFCLRKEKNPEAPALFHSRIGTHGTVGVDTFNLHPFFLGNGMWNWEGEYPTPQGYDTRTIIAHNGILPKDAHPMAGDPRSDTRILAEELIPDGQFGNLWSRRGRRRLRKWLGSNKVVLLTLDPAYRNSYYIFNEDLGEWDSGSWYSNTDYLGWGRWYNYGSSTTTTVTSVGYPSTSDRVTRCEVCLAEGNIATCDNRCTLCYARLNLPNTSTCLVCNTDRAILGDARVCRYCRSCVDCEEEITQCVCTPFSKEEVNPAWLT